MEFLYKTVMDLGFERMESHDGVWFDRHGYDYFIVYKDLPGNFQLEWHPKERTIRLLNLEGKGKIVSHMKVTSRGQLHRILDFLDPKGDHTTAKSYQEQQETNKAMFA